MKRRRHPLSRHRRSRTRHGLQHIGDLLPELISEIESEMDSPSESTIGCQPEIFAVSTNSPSGNTQNTFGFYQSIDAMSSR